MTTPHESEDKTEKRALPAKLPGGFRTSTAGLILAFVLLLALYGYMRPDPTTNENSPVYVPPTTATTEPFIPQRTVAPSTSTRPTTMAPGVTGSTPRTTDTVEPAPTTTTTNGLQVPTVPGLQLDRKSVV